MNRLQHFFSSMMSDDSKVSSKRFTSLTMVVYFLLIIVPSVMFFGKTVSDAILDVFKIVIVANVTGGVVTAIGQAMAKAKGDAGTPDTVINKTDTTVNTDSTTINT